MQYVLPFNEHIELQDIKSVTNVELQIENLTCNSNDLSGNIFVVGNYVTSQQESTGFKHEIPMSFIVDTTRKSPEINIKKFDYKISEGKGLEIIIELEINLEENMDFEGESALNDYQNEIEEKVNNYVQQRKDDIETAEILSVDSSQEETAYVEQGDVCREDDIKELEEAVDDLMEITGDHEEGVKEEQQIPIDERSVKDVEGDIIYEEKVEMDNDSINIDEVDSTKLNEAEESEKVDELFGEVKLIDEEIEPFVILEYHDNNKGETLFKKFNNTYDTIMIHQIQENETIEDIARKYNLSVDYVRELASNPIYLREGKLSIPINSD